MIRTFKISAAAAFALAAAASASQSYAAEVTINGGTSATVDGWQISPDAGITLQAEGVVGGLVIQESAATFTSNSGLGVTLLQTSAAPNIVQFTTAAITDSTGSDWTGFAFSLTGAASIPSVTDVFVPPFGTGVNYTTVSLNPSGTAVTYTGSQSNGSTANWGGTSASDSLSILADGASAPPFATFTLEETPQAAASTGPGTGSGSGTAVPLPSSLWQTGLALLSLGLIPKIRRAIKARA